MRGLRFLWLFVLICCLAGTQAISESAKPEAIQPEPIPASDKSPVPYLSAQDLKALYPAKKRLAGWDTPDLKEVPNKEELIERCIQDMTRTLKADPNPFHMKYPLPPGKLIPSAIKKDADGKLIYFIFTYDADASLDLFVIYYYDPAQNRFILKSTI